MHPGTFPGVCLALLCGSLASLSLAGPPAEILTPIIIRMPPEEPPRYYLVAEKAMDLPALQEWLAGVEERFGSEDPVIVQVIQPTQLLPAARAAFLATQTHRQVFLAVANSTPGEGPFFYPPITGEIPDFLRQPAFSLQLEPPAAPPVPPGDFSPELRNNQLRRFEQIQRGDLP